MGSRARPLRQRNRSLSQLFLPTLTLGLVRARTSVLYASRDDLRCDAFPCGRAVHARIFARFTQRRVQYRCLRDSKEDSHALGAHPEMTDRLFRNDQKQQSHLEISQLEIITINRADLALLARLSLESLHDSPRCLRC